MAFIETDDYEALIDFLFCQSAFLHNEKHFLITIAGLRNLIFDMKHIYSGYASKAAIKQHNGYLSRMTPEHYNPRQKMAEKMVAMVKSGSSKEEVLSVLKEACKIHRVTSDENKNLRPHQRKEDYVAEKAYAEEKIELVLCVGKPRTKHIEVEGKIFESAKSVSKEFSISIDVVRRRVKSKSKKWVSWVYTEKTYENWNS
jgi:hypothetical protein